MSSNPHTWSQWAWVANAKSGFGRPGTSRSAVIVGIVSAGGRTAARNAAGSCVRARCSASVQKLGSSSTVASGCWITNVVNEFLTRRGVNVPSTMAKVGTGRGNCGSAVTVTVRRALGRPTSATDRMNRWSGLRGRTIPYTVPAAAAQHSSTLGARTGSDISAPHWLSQGDGPTGPIGGTVIPHVDLK